MAKINKPIRRVARRPSPAVLQKIMKAATFILTSSVVLISIIGTYYLHTHETQFDTFVSKFEKSEVIKPIAEYIKLHSNKTVGSILATTSILSAVPTSIAPAAAVATSAFIFLAPQAPYAEYLFLTLSLLLFFRVKGNTAKLAVSALILISLALGWWGTKLFTSET